MMIYDTLPMGGASQFHPHAHGFLASQYLGHMVVQHTAALRYEDENSSEYWNDLIEAHHALGLSVTLGDAIAISPLVCYLKTSIPLTKCVQATLI
jgi:galactose-1-phosphate uridylyltransferase